MTFLKLTINVFWNWFKYIVKALVLVLGIVVAPFYYIYIYGKETKENE